MKWEWGGCYGCAPLFGPISFIFMLSPTKIVPNKKLGLRPPPPSGKFWILHWTSVSNIKK